MCYEREDFYKNIYYFYLKFAIDILYSYCTVEYSRETDCTVSRTHNTNHGQLTSPPSLSQQHRRPTTFSGDREERLSASVKWLTTASARYLLMAK